MVGRAYICILMMLDLDKNLIMQCLKEIEISDTFKDLISKKKIDKNELYLVPICFKKNLEVSARTLHGIIYLNSRLKKTPDKIPSYIMHEFTHYVDQTTGSGPTEGSTEDSYLDNPAEIRGFQNQSKYISETQGDRDAEEYIEKVMDHHDVPDHQWEDKKDDLLRLSHKKENPQQLPLFPVVKQQPDLNKLREDFYPSLQKFLQDIEDPLEVPVEKHVRVEKLPEFERKDRIKRIQKLLDSLKD